MRIEADIKLDFQDVLIRPKRSTLKSRSEVQLEREFCFKHSKRMWRGIPLMASNMDSTGTFQVAHVLAKYNALTVIHKHYTAKQWEEFVSTTDPSVVDRAILSTGILDDDIRSLSQLIEISKINAICVDVANGYSEAFVNTVRGMRERYPNTTLIAGNVVTGEMTEELLLAGADIIKVGIGPGSVCTTRSITGVGYPQLSAIIECADAAHGLNGHIIADGGCVTPGDVSKAFGAGADFVMLGGMLAGHDECGGDIIIKGGEKYKRFYGMASSAAMEMYHGGVADYRASEGKCVFVPYRGPLENTVRQILGGVRSTCTYVGAKNVGELSKRTTFLRVNHQINQVFNEFQNL